MKIKEFFKENWKGGLIGGVIPLGIVLLIFKFGKMFGKSADIPVKILVVMSYPISKLFALILQPKGEEGMVFILIIPLAAILMGIIYGFLLNHIIKKKENYKVFLWILIILIFISLVGFFKFTFLTMAPLDIGTLVTTPLFEVEEPLILQSCQSLNGICIPVEQPCSQNRVEYGACSQTQKCCVVDYCLSSGGRYKYEQKIEKNKAIFEKICECPINMIYDIKVGCTIWKK